MALLSTSFIAPLPISIIKEKQAKKKKKLGSLFLHVVFNNMGARDSFEQLGIVPSLFNLMTKLILGSWNLVIRWVGLQLVNSDNRIAFELSSIPSMKELVRRPLTTNTHLLHHPASVSCHDSKSLPPRILL